MVRPTRSRLIVGVLLLATVALGLASRRYAPFLPWWLAKNAGDILYATMAYWLVLLLSPRLMASRAGAVAFLFCVAIEFAKFFQIPVLVAARHEAWGRLIFGVGFHISNLVCYGIGTVLGVAIDSVFFRKSAV
jgi:hypothetical protein